MNADVPSTAYFSSEIDARRAAEDLRAQGCEVDVRSEGGGSSGAILAVSGGACDQQQLQTIVAQYNGRVADSTSTTGTEQGETSAMAGSADAGGGVAGASRGQPAAIIGETDASAGAGTASDDDTSYVGRSSSTGDNPNLD